MKKRKEIELDFEIDKLTNSVENVKSGYRFPTEVSLLTKDETKKLTKKNGWRFDWKSELKTPTREVYKLTITNNHDIVQGSCQLGGKSRPRLYAPNRKCAIQHWKRQIIFGNSGKPCCFCLQIVVPTGKRGICFLPCQNKTNCPL